MGAMSGRAAGFCAGYQMPGYANPVPGRGFDMRGGRGGGFWCRGGGRGWRNQYFATGLTGWQRAGHWPVAGIDMTPQASAPTRDQQMAALKNQAEYFEDALDNIRKRIGALEAQKTES
jgi:hypothetical protein